MMRERAAISMIAAAVNESKSTFTSPNGVMYVHNDGGLIPADRYTTSKVDVKKVNDSFAEWFSPSPSSP